MTYSEEKPIKGVTILRVENFLGLWIKEAYSAFRNAAFVHQIHHAYLIGGGLCGAIPESILREDSG